MNEEIKEVLEGIKKEIYDAECIYDVLEPLLDYITNLEQLKKPLIPIEKKELIDLLYKDHLSNKNKKILENYITRLHNYNEYLLKTFVEKDYKLVKIQEELEKVKDADITGGNLITLINKLENILDGE